MLSIIAVTVSIIVLFFIPGILLLNILHQQDKKKRNLLEELFFIIFSSMLITTAAGTLLAILGAFSLPLLFLINLLFSTVVYFILLKKRIRINVLSYRLTVKDLIIINIFLIFGFFYFFPAQDIYGGLDSGVYVNTGVNLVNEGGISFNDPALKSLPTDIGKQARDTFQLDGYGLYFNSEDDSKIVGQFLPGYPVWLGIAYSLFGLNGFLLITPILAILGLLAVYNFGKILFNSTAAFTGSMLLACNILYLWFARQPLSEILTNLFLIGGLYYLALFLKERLDVYAMLSAGALGTIFLIRMDSVILLIPIGLLFIYFRIREDLGKITIYFSLTVTLFAAIGFFTLVFIFKSYFKLLALYFLDIDLQRTNGKLAAEIFRINHIYKISILLLVAGLFVLILKKAPQWYKALRRLNLNTGYIKAGASGLLASLLVYQIYIRPALPFRFMSPQANSAKRLGWYFMPLKWLGLTDQPLYNSEYRIFIDILLIIFCAGIIFAFYKISNFIQFLTFAVFFSYAVIYFNNLYTVPHHFWLNRRFIVIILPYILLSFGYLVSRIVKRSKIHAILAIVFTGLILASFTGGFALIANHRELDHSIEQLESITEALEDESLYIMDSEPSLQYHLISLPLKYIFNKKIILFENNESNLQDLSDLLPNLLKYYTGVYYCTSNMKRLPPLPYNFHYTEWKQILVRRFETTVNNDYRPPLMSRDMRIQLRLYKLDRNPYFIEMTDRLDIGTGYETFLADGFFNAESFENETYRWTMRNFAFYIPPPGANDKMSIKMANGRPLEFKPPKVSFYLNKMLLHDFYVLQEADEYTLTIPEKYRNSPEPLLIKAVSDTWIPKEANINTDVRNLGIMMYHVKLFRESDNEE